MTFEKWWKQLKPAEVDEFKHIFKECWDQAIRSEHIRLVKPPKEICKELRDEILIEQEE